MSSSEISITGEHRNVEQTVLKPCHICGRTFNPQSLERHEKICEKTQKGTKRRNIFNSFTQRAKDLEAVPNLTDEEEKIKNRKSKEHESISHMKGEKNSTSNVMNNGLRQQKKTPSGYQQCPSCDRCFNQKAADRHIVWCMEQQSRMPKTPPSSQALERLKARVKYQAPLPKSKDSNLRLVKSAESDREPSLMRTHSSPPIPARDIKTSKKQRGGNSTTISILKAQKLKMIDKRLYLQGTRTIIDNLDSGISVLPVISKYEGVVDCFHTIVAEEGAAGLYKGFGALLLEYALQALLLKVAKVTFQEIELLMRPSASKKPVA